MANSKSATKRAKIHERNRVRNRAARTVMRSVIKTFREAVTAGDAGLAADCLKAAHSMIDKTAKKGIIHANAARRYKSRLSLAHGKMSVEGLS